MDDARKHEGFAFADEVADGWVIYEDFDREDAPAAICAGDELLADDTAEGFADHDPDLVTLVCWEDVEDSVECSGGISRVQGAEDQVACFGCCDGE